MKETLISEIEKLEKSLSNKMLESNPQFKVKIEEQLKVKKALLAQMESEEEKGKAEPAVKKETPKKEPKAKAPVKKEEPKQKAKKEPAEKVTIAGKTYTLEECEDALRIHNAKKRSNRESSEKSENKHIATKVSDKAEVIVKQVMSEDSVKRKIEKDPSTAKRQIKQLIKSIEALFTAIEALTGKKISKANREKITNILSE